MFLRICLCILCLNYVSLFGQVIKGKVVDAETMLPIANVSVYVDGSSIGTVTNEEGIFELNVKGIYQPTIIISIINYYTAMIDKAKENISYTVKLTAKVYELKNVIVENNIKNRKRMLEFFKENFIGKNEATSQFKIKNEQDLNLSFDKDNKTLYGSASQTLILLNEYLGYEINFDLQEFEIKFKNDDLKYGIVDQYYCSGTTFFKDISKGKRKYVNRRRKAYLGSTMHLFQSIYNNHTKENNFKFYYNRFETKLDSVFERKDSVGLVYLHYKKAKELVVVYDNYFRTDIYFLNNDFIISSEGNFFPPRAITFYGNMTKYKTGLLLPLDYKMLDQ